MTSTLSGTLAAVVVVAMTTLTTTVTPIYLPGTERSYARYPKWNACVNASLSFEFRTTSPDDALLLYVDDGGTYDFVEVTLHNGRVRLVLNIVDGRDGGVYMEMGNNLNDGRWHRVEVIRNRMETTLVVDGRTDSRYAFGSDFLFGHPPNNSHVFFGGLPDVYAGDIYKLALPSAWLHARFRGHVRNVLYGNCTCQTQRAVMLGGEGVDNSPPEICEIRNPCRDGCLCISNDTTPACDCSELQCVTGMVTHYRLPMDLVSLNTIINPSGLDAKVMGNTIQVPGIVNDAVRVDGKNNYIQVSGPSHRYECLGDLDKCQLGYTLAFWINFEQPCDGQTVYLSNGGHNPDSHGVAMLYDRGNIQFRFRGKNGREWRVKSDNVLPKRWYHVAASWSRDDGLSLYINGDLVDTDISPIVRSSGSRSRDLSDKIMMQSFIIGRPNDVTPVREACPITLDEFNFWSMLKSPDEIRELGPLYNYDLPMDIFRSDMLMNSNINARVRGNPTVEPGKIGNAIHLDGRRDYLDLGDQSDTCLGDISLCVYGITISSWIRFNELSDNMYFFSSGDKGFKLYYDNGRLVGEIQKGEDNWRTEWSGAQTGRWYFVELTWDPDNGIRMFVDQQEVARSNEKRANEVREGSSQLYIGRANTAMTRERYANAVFDEVQLSYGDRERLQKFGFIARGRPTSHFFNMDSIEDRHLVHPGAAVELFADPQLVPGKVRAAINFDGNSQYAAFKDQSRSCLGNVDLCRHGILLAAWIKPGRLSDDMEFFSTGANGIRAWYEGGKLKVAVRTSTREWQIDTDQFAPDEWQFVEISWHPEKGMSLYKDNRLVSRSTKQNVRPRDPDDGYWSELEIDKVGFYLGRGEGLNVNAKYANMTFDEMEYWYGDRDYLIAFDYIQRGLPRRYHFTMDNIRSGRLVHPSMDIPVYGNPSLVPGKIYNAVRLNGNGQYIDLGRHADSCFGNMTRCAHGQTGSFWINFRRFRNNMYYLSTGNGLRIYYRNGRLTFEAESEGKSWTVAVPNLETNKWYFMEYSWHPEKGLQVYQDNHLVGQSTSPRRTTSDDWSGDNHVYVGRANDNDGRFAFGDAIIDEVVTWFSDRDYLVAFDHILRDHVTHYTLPMETQRGNTIVHPNYLINLYGGASLTAGKIGNGVRFSGNGEYLSIGDQRDSCAGNLDRCEHGLTVSFLMNPRRFIENGYFLSSGPYSVYYRDGKVHAKFSTDDNTWEVSTDGVQLNRWQKVELSWDRERGLQMYVDKSLVASSTEGRPNTDGPISDYNVYLGRPNSNTAGYFSDVVMDELEFWYAYRDHLAAFGLLDEEYTPDIYPTGGVVFPGTTAPPYEGGGDPSQGRPVGGGEILFNGREWVAYDMRQLPDDYFEPGTFEEFHIRFKTKEPTGLLWWSGTDEKNMHISLKDGTKLIFFIDYGTGQTDRVKVESTTFGNLADGRWHDVWIKRRGNQTVVKVDNLELPPLTMRGVASLISRGAVYMAGGPDPDRLTGSIVRKNVYGSIDKAVFSGSSLPEDVDLVDLYWRDPRPDYVVVNGDIDLSGPDSGGVSRPGDGGVSFTRRGAYLIVPRLDFQRGGSIEYQFRTTEPDGLLMYNGGPPGSRDFVAMELYGGQLYFVIDLGDGVSRFKFGAEDADPLNDGNPHHVKVERQGQRLRLTLDGVQRDHYIRSRTSSLDLGTHLYVGAIDRPERLPWHLWTSKDKFYRGCLWDVKVNQKEHDLQQYMATQLMQGISPGCKDLSLKCGSRPCLDGVCRERWDDYYCDCSESSQTGRMCERRAPIVSFDGSDFVRVNIHPPLRTHTNDISLRFKTHKPSAVLFSTSNREANDYLRISLENGRGRLDTNLGGQDLVTFFCDGLNDDEWHTLHVKRQAESLKYWVDDCEPRTTNLTGEGFSLDIDQILVASLGRNADPDLDFVGHMQNFYVNGHRFFEYLRDTDLPPGVRIDLNGGSVGDREQNIKYYPVTFRSGTNSYVYVPSLRLDGDMKFKFMFKTKDPNGMLFYNGGDHHDFIMAELVNGNLYFGLDDGGGAQVVKISDQKLNDNQWHMVDIQQGGPQIFRIRVDDGVAVSVNRPPSTHSFNINDKLYMGGVPDHVYSSLHPLINSRNGFSGCLATLKVDGRLYVLPNEAISSSELVVPGCSDASGFCSLNSCRHFGICKETLNTFLCDCNMTAHVGDICTEEPEGYRISKHNQQGIALFTFDYPQDTEIDKLAFGFMTWNPNGTMIRTESGFSADYIDAKLVNGHVVVTYDIGNGPQVLVEDAQRFNDGQYHYVTFVRRRGDATLRVDDYPVNSVRPGGTATLFNELKYLTIGGELDSEQRIKNYFNGILAGVYLNGYRVIDLGLKGDHQMMTRGDVEQAHHFFHLERPSLPTPAPTPFIPGRGTPAIPAEPVGPGDGGDGDAVVGPPGGADEVVPDKTGGGVIWVDGKDGGESILVRPDGVSGAGVGTGGGGGGGGPAAPGVAAARVGAGGLAGAPEGARASVVAGTFLGLLALASGIGWAFYKFKPGLLTAGGGPPGSTPLNISSPTPGSALLKSNAGGGGMSAVTITSANGAAATGIGVGMASASTQTPAAMGPAGAAAANFQVLTGGAAAGSGIAGVSTARGTVTRPTQTDLYFVPGSPPPVVMQSVVSGGGYSGAGSFGEGYSGASGGGAVGMAGYSSSSYAMSQQASSSTMNAGGAEFDAVDARSGAATSGYGHGAGYSQGSGYASIKNVASAETQTPDLSPIAAPSQPAYDAGGQMMNYQSSVYGAESTSMYTSSYKESSSYNAENAMAQTTGQRSRTLSPPPDGTLSHSYQMRNMAMIDAANRTSTGPNIFLAAEEIRVDCLELTADGRYVITGSIFGPPQVWDMRTGELVRVMAGDDLSSTDIHLAAGDSLLVGQVAEMTQVDPRDTLATTRVHNRKLQLWDFSTGHPLEMGHNEHCTASCMMKDGEKMVLGRTDKYGGGTTIVIWDLLGNEPIRKLKLDASVGFADHITYLNLSLDNRYVVAGFQNSYDGYANFIVFDLTVADYTNVEPVMLALDADADVTTMLANHEALTGTRKGELTVWSLRTGKALRQFVSPSAGVHTLTRAGALTTPAHNGNINAIAVSDDRQYMVSASSDTTLKVWAIQSEKHMFTLRGHTDEVWCCTISHDNDIIASGSRDATIRLWRTQNGVQICSFKTGVDIFTVKMTRRKRTVVALGDKYGARKLIMLQVVHTKTRSRTGSQTTSPISSPILNHY